MWFGKFAGTPMSEVPTDYLVWVVESFRATPGAVVRELRRRGETSVEGACLLAEADKSPRRRGRRRRNVAPQAAGRSIPAPGGVFVGGDFHRLRAAFVASGGDCSSCPFGESSADQEAMFSHWRSIVEECRNG